MLVVIETPKYSFTKYVFKDGGYDVGYRTLFPSFFNYGFVKYTVGEDGNPKDALVLGPRLKQGDEVEVHEVGVVHFIDDGLKDDKYITSADGGISWSEKTRIRLFFTTYMLYKRLYYLFMQKRAARVRYGGFTLLPPVR